MRECRRATRRRGNRSRVSGAIAPDTRDKDGEGKTKTGQNRRREGRAGPRPQTKKIPRPDEWTNIKCQKLITSDQKHKSDLSERDR